MNSAEFGWKIRQARKRQGLTQLELARKTHAGRRFISELEAGKESIELGKALTVASILGVRDFGGPYAVEIARQLDVPRFWAAPNNVTPEMLIAGVLKNPTFDDVLCVARHYGVEPLHEMHMRLNRRGEMTPLANKEAGRMLRNIEAGLHAA